MVQTCSADNCKNRKTKGVKLKYHRVPKEPKLRELWLDALGKVPSPSSTICEKHFTPDDYELNVHGNRVLKKTAVPSVFDLEKKPRRRQVPKRKREETSTNVSVESLFEGVDNSGNSKLVNADSLNVGTSNMNVHTELCQPLTLETFSLSFEDLDEEVDCENHVVVGFIDENGLHIPEEIRNNFLQDDLIENSNIQKQLLLEHNVDLEEHESNLDVTSFEEVEKSENYEPIHLNILEPAPPIMNFENESTDSFHSTNEKKCVSSRRQPVFFGDFQYDDLDDIQRRKRFWKVSHDTLNKYRKNLKYYQCKITRQRDKIKSLKSLLEELLQQEIP